MAFLTEFSWPVHNLISQPISKISTDLRSMKKSFFHAKLEKIFRNLTHPNSQFVIRDRPLDYDLPLFVSAPSEWKKSTESKAPFRDLLSLS